jgi:Exopolysaccharide biosynthesis protein YbjH
VPRGYVYLHLLILILALPSVARAGPARRPSGEERVPNFLGATGLLLIPSAYIQRDRQVAAFVSGSSASVAGGIVAGIRNRLELSVTGVDAEDDFADGSSGLLLNAKLSLVKETLSLPALSIGVIDAFDTLDQHPGWYVVASKYVIPYFVQAVSGQDLALKLHLGFGGGIYDEELFAGAELFFRAPLAVMAEYANGELNLGGRYHARRWSATLGWFDFRHIGGGIAYTAAFR